MPSITTAQLWTAESTKLLLVDPLFAKSNVLPFLKRISTDASVMYLPKVEAGTAGWVAELAPIPPSGVQASEVEVRPKKCAALETVSSESAADAAAVDIVGGALVDSLVSTVDAAFVNGGGANGPEGLPGLAAPSAVDASPATLEAWVDALTTISVAGGQATVLYISPQDWAVLMKLPATAGGNVPAFSPGVGPSGEPEMRLYGVQVSVVPALAAGTGWAVDGNRTVVVDRTDARVETNAGPMFTSDGISVRATVRLEFASLYEEAVCKVTDVP